MNEVRMHEEIQRLVYDLKSDVEDIRRDACRILAQEGDLTVIDELKEICSHDTVAVRYFARKAINAITGRCGALEKPAAGSEGRFIHTDSITGDAVFDEETYRAWLQSGEAAKQTATLNRALDLSTEFGSPVVLPHIIACLPVAAGTQEKAMFIKTVGLLGGREQIAVISPFLSDPDSRVRADTVEALEYIGDPEIYPLIVPLLQDEDNRVKANAAVALKHYGEDHSLQLLEDMITGDEVWMRDSATFALREIKSARSIDLLVSVLQNEIKYTIYAKAAEGLAKIGERALIPRIKQLLQAAADKRKRHILNSLITSLRGRSAGTTETGSQPAGEQDVLEIVSALIKDLSNPDEDIRKQASIKLMRIRDPRAGSALEKAATDPDNVVRYYAKKALRALEKDDIYRSEAASGLFAGRLPRVLGAPLKYAAVVAGGLMVVLLAGWMLFSWLAPEKQVLEAKKIAISSFERIVTSYNRYMGTGEQVTWKGIIREIDRERRMIVVSSHSYTFTATLSPEEFSGLYRGDVVEVRGEVKDRTLFGVVNLEAGTVRVTEPNMVLRRQQKQAAEYAKVRAQQQREMTRMH